MSVIPSIDSEGNFGVVRAPPPRARRTFSAIDWEASCDGMSSGHQAAAPTLHIERLTLIKHQLDARNYSKCFMYMSWLTL